ncbi:unnamed protein product [Amoebophrya sp. A120]|nr:unnamed protein product [Amoebophrya sp. A120]|eukprot:GSA120T00014537001.1
MGYWKDQIDLAVVRGRAEPDRNVSTVMRIFPHEKNKTPEERLVEGTETETDSGIEISWDARSLSSGSFGTVTEVSNNPPRPFFFPDQQTMPDHQVVKVVECPNKNSPNAEQCLDEHVPEVIFNVILSRTAQDCVARMSRLVVSSDLNSEGELKTRLFFFLEKVEMLATTSPNAGMIPPPASDLGKERLTRALFACYADTFADLGLAHNDVKPNNIGYTGDEAWQAEASVRVFDFDMSSFIAVKDAGATVEGESATLMTGSVMLGRDPNSDPGVHWRSISSKQVQTIFTRLNPNENIEQSCPACLKPFAQYFHLLPGPPPSDSEASPSPLQLDFLQHPSCVGSPGFNHPLLEWYPWRWFQHHAAPYKTNDASGALQIGCWSSSSRC